MKFLNTVTQGDCLQLMAQLPDSSVDMVLCDLPYGTTQNKWDSIISLPALWAQYKRIVKPSGALVFTAAQPFTSALVMSNPGDFKYEWIWEKEAGTGFLNAKKQPLRSHESVLLFYREQPTYNPQMEAGEMRVRAQGKSRTANYGDHTGVGTVVYSEGRYPKTILRFNRDSPRLHPTQKPVALFEYLIRTYTNPGDVVLDCCCGSGTTGLAAQNAGRQFIQFELNPAYCEMARRRLAECEPAAPLFLPQPISGDEVRACA